MGLRILHIKDSDCHLRARSYDNVYERRQMNVYHEVFCRQGRFSSVAYIYLQATIFLAFKESTESKAMSLKRLRAHIHVDLNVCCCHMSLGT